MTCVSSLSLSTPQILGGYLAGISPPPKPYRRLFAKTPRFLPMCRYKPNSSLGGGASAPRTTWPKHPRMFQSENTRGGRKMRHGDQYGVNQYDIQEVCPMTCLSNPFDFANNIIQGTTRNLDGMVELLLYIKVATSYTAHNRVLPLVGVMVGNIVVKWLFSCLQLADLPPREPLSDWMSPSPPFGSSKFQTHPYFHRAQTKKRCDYAHAEQRKRQDKQVIESDDR